ncbi:hypothetical protein BW686_17300 [Pseudomonas syringae]|uniref:Uncharacterized protein n=1 Tax=Pseudomonas syringae TaxID=317 RepID=A0A244ENP0_PSESX|nr:hypothetical protein [Pseudomonas syringae]OUM06058.1 hypothetical protein BW686_17300 [Pseudomonas syringae]
MMNKKELKNALLTLVVGLVSGYMVLLLPQPSNQPKTEPQICPQLMYVQRQQVVKAGNQCSVDTRQANLIFKTAAPLSTTLLSV